MGTRDIQDQLDNKFSILIQHIPSGQIVSFSAFLDRFSDDYKQDWATEQVYGRMDPVYFFKNTTRKMSIGFYVPSENGLDAQANFKKLSKLIRFNYPVYEKPLDPKSKGAEQSAGTVAAGSGQSAANAKSELAKAVATATNNAMLLSSPPLIGIRFANFASSPANGGKLIGKIGGVKFEADKEATYYSVGQNLYPSFYKVDLDFDILHSVPLGWEKDSSGKVSLRDTNKFPYGV